MSAKQIFSVALPALVCGALLGYFLHPTSAVEPPSPKTEKSSLAERSARKDKPTLSPADLNRLRARIKELERQLADKAATEEKVAENVPPPQATGRRRWGPPTPEELEELRKTNPEEYIATTNRMEHFRQMVARNAEMNANRLDILASVDTSRMNDKQRATHERYQEMFARREELRAQMGGDITDEQRHKLHEQEREVSHQLGQLAQQERNILLNQASRAFGITGENQKELVETIKAVVDATAVGWGHGHGRRGGPPPGGPRPR